MESTCTRRFICSAIVIFAVTAAAKIYSATGTARILNASDPLFGVSMRTVLLGVGLLEGAVALYLALGRSNRIKLGLIVWMASNFGVYRVGLWFMNSPRPCRCLGTVTDKLPVDKATVDWSMKVILGYLFIGGALFLMRELAHKRAGDGEKEKTKPEGLGKSATC